MDTFYYDAILSLFREKNLTPAFNSETFNINSLSFVCSCGRIDYISLRVLKRVSSKKCWYCSHSIKGSPAEKEKKFQSLLVAKGLTPFPGTTYPPGTNTFRAFCSCGEPVTLAVRYLWEIPDGKKYRCKKCISLTYAESGEEIRNRFLKMGAQPLFTSEQYKNRESLLEFKCECGRKEVTTWGSVRHRKKILCVSCRYKSKRLNTEYVKEMFHAANKEPLFDTYVSGRIPLLCRCKSCGREVKSSVYEIIKQVKTGVPSCRGCAGARKKLSWAELQAKFEAKNLKPLFSYEEYKNRSTPLRVMCSCGAVIYRCVADLICSGLCASCQFKYTRVRGETHGRFNPVLKREKYDPHLHLTWKKDLMRLFRKECFFSEKGEPLVAHHLQAKSKSPLNVFNVSNGVLLRPEYHTAFHKAYGFGKNTEKQFLSWLGASGKKRTVSEFHKESNFFVSKQLLRSDLFHFCSRLGVTVCEDAYPYLLTLRKGQKYLNICLVKTNRAPNLSAFADKENTVFVFEQEFLSVFKREALFRDLERFFSDSSEMGEPIGKEIPRQLAKKFLARYCINNPLRAGTFFGAYLGKKLVAVASFKELPEKTHASYQLVTYAWRSHKQKGFEAIIQELNRIKKPLRIVLEFEKRFQPLLPKIGIEFSPSSDTMPKLFYAKNSFQLLPGHLFEKPESVRWLSMFDPKQDLTENLRLNQYHAVSDLGKTRFVFSRKELKKQEEATPGHPCIEIPTNIENLVEKYYQYYREKGFPYYEMTPFEKMQVIQELRNQPSVLSGNQLKRGHYGLSLLWSYFPHAWEISCNSRRTAMELFRDDILFRIVLTEALQKKSKLTPSEVRGLLKTSMGVQTVSNFRPLAAKALYDTYAGSGVVYDPCAGFGGRLLGAILSPAVKKYIGVEPSTKTYRGLQKIRDEFGSDTEVELIHGCAEEVTVPAGTVDLCFTSPPYFNCERYSNETTQSCIRHPTKEEWVRNFFQEMISRCEIALKEDGYLIVNIANVPSFRNLVQVVTQIITQKGFVLISSLKYVMNSFGKKGEKFEPILVYKKRSQP